MVKTQMVFTGIGLALTGIGLGVQLFEKKVCQKTEKYMSSDYDSTFKPLEEALYNHFKPIIVKELGLEDVRFHVNPHSGSHIFAPNTLLGVTGKNLFDSEMLVVELYRQGMLYCTLLNNFGKLNLERYAICYVNILAHELRHVKQFALEGYNMDDLQGSMTSVFMTGVRKEVEKVAYAYGNSFAKTHLETIRSIVKGLNK